MEDQVPAVPAVPPEASAVHGLTWPGAGAPRSARIAIGVLLALVTGCFAWFVLGMGDGLMEGWIGGATNTLALLAAATVAGLRVRQDDGERLLWGLLAAGLLLWALGGAIWSVIDQIDSTPPIPSVADAFWLAFYVPVYAAIVLLARKRVGHLDPRTWIDGLIAALAVGSLSSSVVLPEVTEALGEQDRLQTAVNLLYPIADTLLLAMVVAVMVSAGPRGLDGAWLLVGISLLVFAVTDSIYLFQIAGDTYAVGGPLDFGWVAGCTGIALAAWQPSRAVPPGPVHDREHGIGVPVALAFLGLGVLVVDHFDRAPVYGVGLAAASLALVQVRLLMSHAESRANLRTSRRQALTDSLTGLGNRLSLVRQLDALWQAGTAGGSHVLLLLDLDGFKHYNDTFGHPAGDALLRRLGRRLADAMAGDDAQVFRMGGDEFCVLLPWTGTPPITLLEDHARAAMTEGGDGFGVGASCGHVVLGAEASQTSEALRIADRRLYADKRSSRLSARVQGMLVLAGAMREWDAALCEHGSEVGATAGEVARWMGLDEDEVEHVVVAAELHDVGKIAIPRSILQKPAPLDDDEWAFLRRHTLIGERIVQTAPALASVGPVIRSSHERWDGTGYPDGLRGDEIPLGSQIVFVCDALAAMTSDRAYRRAIPLQDALEELRANAGTQFSPAAVEAICAVVAAREATATVPATRERAATAR